VAIEAVIFDFGGVLSVSPFGGLAAAEVRLGLQPGALVELLGYGVDVTEPEPGQPYTNKWHLLEIGAIEIGEYVEWVRDRSEDLFGHRVDLAGRMLNPDTSVGLSIMWPMVHEVRRLRQAGYKTAILTNNVAAYRPMWTTQIPMDMFDLVIDSSEVGVRKPDPAIYLLTAERLGVVPTECVFLDDHPGNVTGARAVGMRAVHVQDDDVMAAITTLRELLDSPASPPS
jgi:putative hydrolase of the HAD superfamily